MPQMTKILFWQQEHIRLGAILLIVLKKCSSICVESDVKLNTHYNYDYIDDYGLWQAITCHEFGHVLGLPHITDYSQSSIMYPITGYYYDVDGTLKIKSPQSVDIANVNTIYNHTYTYTALDASNHIYWCNKCDYWVTKNHVYTYSSVDSTYHTGECVYCGHETGNEIHRWRDYSLTHVVCKDCGQLKRLPDDGFIPIIKGVKPETETE